MPYHPWTQIAWACYNDFTWASDPSLWEIGPLSPALWLCLSTSAYFVFPFFFLSYIVLYLPRSPIPTPWHIDIKHFDNVRFDICYENLCLGVFDFFYLLCMTYCIFRSMDTTPARADCMLYAYAVFFFKTIKRIEPEKIFAYNTALNTKTLNVNFSWKQILAVW